MNHTQAISPGRMSKGGHNDLPPHGGIRPDAPGASGNTAAGSVRKAIDVCVSREANMNTLMVYPIGARVRIGIGNDQFVGEVLAIAIYAHNIQYQVAWWNGRARSAEWLEDLEVQPVGDAAKASIGFAGSPQLQAEPQVIYRG